MPNNEGIGWETVRHTYRRVFWNFIVADTDDPATFNHIKGTRLLFGKVFWMPGAKAHFNKLNDLYRENNYQKIPVDVFRETK